MPPTNVVDDDDDSSSESSASVPFDSPTSSVNYDDELLDDASSPLPEAAVVNSNRKLNTFEFPPANSQDDSVVAGQSSPALLATQPASSQTQQQPSTPSPIHTKTSKTELANSNNNNKGKKRKVSMSPTDSLARTNQNSRETTKRRTSPRTKANKKVPKQQQQQEVIEIEENDDDCNNGVRSTSPEMTNVEKPTTKADELKSAKITEPHSGVGNAVGTCSEKKSKVKQSTTCHNPAVQKLSDTATIKDNNNDKQSSSVQTKSKMPPKETVSSSTTATTKGAPTTAATKTKKVTTKKKKTLVASNNTDSGENTKKTNTAPSSNAKGSKKRLQKVDSEEVGAPSKKKPKTAASGNTPDTTSNSNTKSVSGASQSSQPVNSSTTTAAKAEATVEAKKPPKKKKRTFDNRLLQHLFTSCKPFTAKALAQQLDTNETSINHCMLSLADKGWVSKKEFTSKGGRSKELIWANQSAVNKYKGLSDALSMASSRDITAAKEERSKLEKEDRHIAQSMEQVTKEPSNEELDGLLSEAQAKLSELEQKRDSTLARIENANDNDSNKRQLSSKFNQPAQVGGRKKQQLCTAAKKKNTPHSFKNRINLMRDEWKKRKNKCMDFVDNLADGMEKKVKDVVKLLDIETDESEGVKMPPKYVLK